MYKYSNNLVLKQVRNAKGKTNNKTSCLGKEKKKKNKTPRTVREGAAAIFLMQ